MRNLGAEHEPGSVAGLAGRFARLAALNHIEPVALDGLAVVVDVAPEGPLRGNGDDLGASALHPLDGAYLLQELEGFGHVRWQHIHGLAQVGGRLGALV